HYPLEAQRSEAQNKRRMGLGVTGLADALIFLGKRYDTADARATARGWMSFIQSEAYAASAALAAEKGAFPLFDEDAILAAPNVQRLPKNVRDAIRADGLRNGCLTSIAPTGTISLLAGNVSSGIEPVFDLAYKRKVLNADGTSDTIEIEDYAYASYKAAFGTDEQRDPAAGGTPSAKTLPEYFVTATGLSPQAHLDMQNALQPYVDSSISKTINCPADASFEDIKTVYSTAYAMGLKGCTTYRPTPLRGAVLSSAPVDIEPDASSLRPVQNPASVADHPVDGPTGGAHGGESTVGALTPVADPTASEPMRSSTRGDVVYMAHPLSRERALNGVTYKLKWPESDHAIYVTLNDIETDGRRRPFEIFINTRNLEHYAWTVALTRMISAVFRRGGDVSFVADELQAVFDPQGGRWIKGRYVPSLLAAIGDIIDEHLTSIGFYRQTAASSASLDAESHS
ncbi:MAG: ribonucleoside-diphosphate reductase, adenosylcobalamin-dependent, partial [Pseudomonadota bacterium]